MSGPAQPRAAAANDRKAWHHDLISAEEMAEAAAQTQYFEMTDLGNGERLAFLFGEDISWVEDEKQWAYWDDSRWIDDLGSKLRTMAGATARAISMEGTFEHRKWSKRSESAASMHAMIETAMTQMRPETGTPIAVRSSIFDTDATVLNCLNGTVNLTDGSLRPHDRTDMLRKITPTRFDPVAHSAVWDKFLSSSLGGDKDVMDYVQLLAGATLLGTNEHDVVVFVTGPGGSGKSTFINALTRVIGGDYAVTASIETFGSARVGGGPREDIARMEGARMVSASESDHDQPVSVSLLKRLSGGDSITARGLYKGSRTFIPQMTIWFAVNDLPVIARGEKALWRRVKVIPFDHPASNPDPTLRRLLGQPEHAEAILAWMVEGALRLTQRRRLPAAPGAIKAATAKYELRTQTRPTDQSVFDEWLADCCEDSPGEITSARELYSSYSDYCAAADAQELTMKSWGTKMGQAYNRRHTNKGSSYLEVALCVSD